MKTKHPVKAIIGSRVGAPEDGAERVRNGQVPKLPEEQPVGKRRPDATETCHQEPDAIADAEQTLPEKNVTNIYRQE